MRLQMRSQIGFVGKGAIAVLAFEWLVAGMGANVSLQQPWSAKCFAAQRALAWFCVCFDVHFQRTAAGVRFRAELAIVGFFRLVVWRGDAMELLVLGEAGVGGIGFRAVGALVARQIGFDG